jgi:hypothetical protein
MPTENMPALNQLPALLVYNTARVQQLMGRLNLRTCCSCFILLMGKLLTTQYHKLSLKNILLYISATFEQCHNLPQSILLYFKSIHFFQKEN